MQSLKFILQPIVENSIIHGIGEDEKTVRINILVREVHSILHISISDDGMGFDTDEADIRPGRSRLSGIGIKNVDERIKLNFGEMYGISISSNEGEGTKVSLRLPKLME